MAPEQFRGLEIDRRVGIYATGVLLYRLLVGKPPFTGSTESLSYRVVHEAPVLPSAVLGYQRGAQYDSVLAIALSKEPARRYATAQAFKLALISVIDIPVAATVSDETVIAVAPRGPARAFEPGPGHDGSAADRPAAGTGTSPTNWDPLVLSQVEATLARHVGPLASVLVRRTARDCADLPSLVQRLADQVTNAHARDAFLAQSLKHTTNRGTGSVLPQGSRAGSASGGAAVATGRVVTPLSDSFIAQGTKLLAAHIGPIASVLAKRAAARGGGREAFVAALTEAVTDAAAREKLRAELSRLQ